MRLRQEEIDAAGAAVYAVSFETPARLRAYVRAQRLPYPVLADPARRVYARYGMGRGPWWRIYGPRVLWGYLRAYLRGQRVRVKGDTLQRGGDFVIDAAGRVRLAHVGEDSFDRPAVERLVRALHERGSAPEGGEGSGGGGRPGRAPERT